MIAPPMISVPVSGYGTVGLEWSGLGPLVACIMIAVLIASLVGLLQASVDRTRAAQSRGSRRSGGYLSAQYFSSLRGQAQAPRHSCGRPQPGSQVTRQR